MNSNLLRVLILTMSAACTHAPEVGVLSHQGDDGARAASPEAFVRQTFLHGVPYEQARSLGPEATKTLLAMLQDPANGPYRFNIVVALGILADPISVEPLLDVVQQGAGPLSPDEYTVRKGAIMALGYLVNGSADERALRYLRESAEPEVWAQRDLQWSSPFAASASEQDHQLAQIAILGLALSGKPEAGATLQEVAASRPGQSSLESTLARAASDALREHAIIARDGLAAYYRRSVSAAPSRR